MNVFDLVEDFYQQDPEWDTVVPQAQIENYLRSKSWQGAEEEELVKLWEQLTVFCVYLGNSENFLGDMNRENFIDCVSWCTRNVADFKANGDNIGSFLDTVADFYKQLFKKHMVHNVKAPLDAKEKLLVNGVMRIMAPDGVFLNQLDTHNQYSTPDLPAKIFLNVGEKLDALQNALQSFFEKPRFAGDFKRASYLYGGMTLSEQGKHRPEWEEINLGFWDYFLCDYHMLKADKTPLEVFKEEIDSVKNNEELSRDMLEELLKARLVLFTIDGPPVDEVYPCVDFLTGESYSLSLPLEAGTQTDKILFMGHVFYNDSMVVSFMKGLRLMENGRKRLKEVLKRGRDWYAIRKGGEVSWKQFIDRNALYVRQSASFVANYVKVSKTEPVSAVENYIPCFPKEDEITRMLIQIMGRYSFTAHDIELTLNMWGDFLKASGKQPRVAECWVAALIRCFTQLNKVYNYDLDSISQMCYCVPVGSVHRCVREIREALKLEDSDPRYISEEGMLSLLIEVNP